MAVIDVALEVIDDNPYNPRKHYPQAKVREMAQSLWEVGLRQVPEGRHVDGRVQLAYGHMRLRGFRYNQKMPREPEKWTTMPIDVKQISDQDMFHFSMEENLTRTDITPIEGARCIENYFVMFPDETETELAKKHNMTQGNISNMRRVLQLPEKILDKIDEGRINFHQGRELIILEKLENSEELMLTAVRSIRIEGRPYGHANTVEGMQKAVHEVIANHCRPLDKQFEGYRYDLIFDTRAAGCLECEKMIRTHPTKSVTAHYCLDDKCWNRHQEEQQEKVSAEAKAKMEADIVRRAAQETISQEIPTSCQDCPTLKDCINSQVWQTYKGNPACPNRGIKPRATTISQEIPEELKEPATVADQEIEEIATIPEPKVVAPAKTYRIQNRTTHEWWDGEAASAQEACEKAGWPIGDCWVREKTERGGWGKPSEAVEAEKIEAIPEDILALAREKAGTRAQVLDLKDIGAGYYGDVKQGYALLDGTDRALEHILDPDECLERCTHGFHFAFDSRQAESRTRYVCSDPKCLTKKKAAFTRAKNAEGQARKKAETKAIKEAIDLVGQVISDGKQLLDEEGKFTNTLVVPRATLKLILLAQMDGRHTERGYYSGSDGKNPETWLWEKLSAGTPAIGRKREDLFKRIDKLSDEELAKLVVEFMFYYLIDKGDIGSYEIKTTEPLKWIGINIEAEPEGDKDHG